MHANDATPWPKSYLASAFTGAAASKANRRNSLFMAIGRGIWQSGRGTERRGRGTGRRGRQAGEGLPLDDTI